MTLGFAPCYSYVRFRLSLGDPNRKLMSHTTVHFPYTVLLLIAEPEPSWAYALCAVVKGNELYLLHELKCLALGAFIHDHREVIWRPTLLLYIIVWSLEEKYRALFSQNFRIIMVRRRPSSTTQHCHHAHHNHILKWHIYVSCKYVQGWSLYHFPGKPAAKVGNTFCEEILSNIQSKPTWVQPEAISSWLIPTSLRPHFRYLQRAIKSPLSLEVFFPG